jgi:type IV fimbrial biogenesis protein FimT
MQNTKGFTLAEMVISLSILAVIITLAVPSFANLVKSNRASALTNNLLTSLHMARSESIRQNRPVTMCKSSDRLHCSGRWGDGWILFSDADRNRRIDADQGDRMLAVADAVGSSLKLSWNGFRSDNYVQFSSMGFIHSNNGTFKICPPDNDVRQARAVIINRVGRARVSSDRDNDGIHEDARGKPLVCP